jgi:hypothetical protein
MSIVKIEKEQKSVHASANDDAAEDINLRSPCFCCDILLALTLDRTADNQFNFGPSSARGTTSFFLRNTNKDKPFLRILFCQT